MIPGIHYKITKSLPCVEDGDDSNYYELGQLQQWGPQNFHAFPLISYRDIQLKAFISQSPLMKLIANHREELCTFGLKFLGSPVQRIHMMPADVFQMNVKYRVCINQATLSSAKRLTALSNKMDELAPFSTKDLQESIQALGAQLKSRALIMDSEADAVKMGLKLPNLI